MRNAPREVAAIDPMPEQPEQSTDLVRRVARLQQQCALIGQPPEFPLTIKGRGASVLASLAQPALERYIPPVRETLGELTQVLGDVLEKVAALEDQVQEQRHAARQAQQNAAELESRLQEQCDALQRARQQVTSLEIQLSEQGTSLQHAQRHASALEGRFQEHCDALKHAQQQLAGLEGRIARQDDDVRLDLQVLSAPAIVLVGSWFRIRVRLRNWSGTEFAHRDPYPVMLSYHCYLEGLEVVLFEGQRTPLPNVKPGAAAEVDMDVLAPCVEGKVLFRLTLVQEGLRWFDAEPLNVFWDTWVQVASPNMLALPGPYPELHDVEEPISRRLLLTSTPRSGNTWLRTMLRTTLDITEAAIDTPPELDWVNLPDGFVVQMHARRTATILNLLSDFNIQPLVVIRHPLDVLISILHFCTFETRTARWLDGEGGSETSILGRSPVEPEFLEYALSTRAEVLLGISPEWLRAGCRSVRYENLVAAPAEVLEKLLRGQPAIVPVEKVVDDCRIEKLRASARNRHFWRGQPGLWRSLIPAAWAAQIYSRHQEVFESLGYDVEGAVPLNPSEIQATWEQF